MHVAVAFMRIRIVEYQVSPPLHSFVLSCNNVNIETPANDM